MTGTRGSPRAAHRPSTLRRVASLGTFNSVAPTDETPELIVADAAAWRAWLAAHHAESTGVSLVMAKKGVTDPTSLTYAEALDDALCFGWIDGRRNSRDEATFLQRFTPRRRASPWSARNVGKVEQLIAEGRMHAAGHAEIDRAKADGRWDRAYAGSATSTVPDDLAAALAAAPDAAAMFEVLSSQNRFAIILRVNEAKRPETRAKRIAQYVDMLTRGETIHPQRRTRG
jgi:uncharacterized protein YdeI (YjbR/CyaY-like superfamily)